MHLVVYNIHLNYKKQALRLLESFQGTQLESGEPLLPSQLLRLLSQEKTRWSVLKLFWLNGMVCDGLIHKLIIKVCFPTQSFLKHYLLSSPRSPVGRSPAFSIHGAFPVGCPCWTWFLHIPFVSDLLVKSTHITVVKESLWKPSLYLQTSTGFLIFLG